MKRHALLFVLLVTGLLGIQEVWSEESKLYTLGGSVQMRGEAKRNADFTNAADDRTAFFGSRFRIDFKFSPHSDLDVFFQPQFSKTWGASEFVASGTAGTNLTGSEQDTSGALRDSGLDVHQAYAQYRLGIVEIKAGRQELVYGDHLVLGNVGWSHVGRSFDAAKVRTFLEAGWIDLFFSKLVERDTISNLSGDRDLYGLYSGWSFGPPIEELDLYVLYLSNQSSAASYITTFGARLKSLIKPVDYRMEATYQTGSGDDEYQLDAEVGYLLMERAKLRVSAEGFLSSKAYNQLYPTAHKWLGLADLFMRRNISGYRAGISGNLMEGFSLRADLHGFLRTDKTIAAYSFSGSAMGTSGSEAAIAHELDVVAKYALNKSASLLAGAAVIFPGAYTKANAGSDMGSWYFLQLAATM